MTTMRHRLYSCLRGGTLHAESVGMLTCAQKHLLSMLANLDQMQARIAEAQCDPKSSSSEPELNEMWRLTKHMMITVEQAIDCPLD
jgi:hypothetical protein